MRVPYARTKSPGLVYHYVPPTLIFQSIRDISKHAKALLGLAWSEVRVTLRNVATGGNPSCWRPVDQVTPFQVRILTPTILGVHLLWFSYGRSCLVPDLVILSIGAQALQVQGAHWPAPAFQLPQPHGSPD